MINPLKNTLTEKEIEGVFLNLEELVGFHAEFLEKLRERLTTWDNESTIGDIFLKNVTFPFIVFYFVFFCFFCFF